MDGSAAKMRNVVLMGTSHKHQLAGNTSEVAFRDFVEHICDVFKVRAIAEEMNLEALVQKHASQSLCERIANAKGVTHRYCDPNNEQRQTLHIRQEQDIRLDAFFNDWDQERVEQEVRVSHAIREHYWLNKLLDLNCWPVLFLVCGADHIEYFRGAFESNDLYADVAAWNWSNLETNPAVEHSHAHPRSASR